MKSFCLPLYVKKIVYSFDVTILIFPLKIATKAIDQNSFQLKRVI